MHLLQACGQTWIQCTVKGITVTLYASTFVCGLFSCLDHPRCSLIGPFSDPAAFSRGIDQWIDFVFVPPNFYKPASCTRTTKTFPLLCLAVPVRKQLFLKAVFHTLLMTDLQRCKLCLHCILINWGYYRWGNKCLVHLATARYWNLYNTITHT